MAAFSTIIGALGLTLAAAGTGLTFLGQQRQASAQARAEEQRRKAMELDAERRRREAIRNAMLARSQALTNATAQGAQEGSGLQGGFGQIAGKAAQDLLAIGQGVEIGREIFAANADAAAGGTMAALGSGLSSFGGAVVKNVPVINRVGNYYTGGSGFGGFSQGEYGRGY